MVKLDENENGTVEMEEVPRGIDPTDPALLVFFCVPVC